MQGPNASSAGGQNHGAGGQVQPQGDNRAGASGKGALEGIPSAYTCILERPGKLRANATRSEEAGDKALHQFW